MGYDIEEALEKHAEWSEQAGEDIANFFTEDLPQAALDTLNLFVDKNS